MDIRVLDKREINDARHIIKSQWGKTYSILFSEEALQVMQHPANAIYGKFSNDGTLQGIGMVTKDQIDYSLWGITWLVVCEELRGCGIGSELLSVLEGFAATRQCDYPSENCIVMLTTTIPNFYSKRGYQTVHSWRGITLMVKDLTNQTV